MRGSRLFDFFLPAVLSLALLVLAGAGCGENEGPPKLVVVIVLDGFRADYADRFLDVLEEGGLRFLYHGGTVFTNARVDHFFSATSPGHAAIATGCYPARNGIAANKWWDRETGSVTVCGYDSSSSELGAPGVNVRGVSPSQMRGPHVTEEFRAICGPGARIFSVSVKSRAAAMMGGRCADGVFWLSESVGGFTTSSWYAHKLPEWVSGFNHESALSVYRGGQWDLLLPFRGQEKCREDRCGYETDNHSLGVVFPHPITEDTSESDSSHVHTLKHTPLLDEFTGDFVERLICEEGLGTDSTPDLLLVSFSCIDEVGHDFGPFSLEVGDAVYRIDRVLSHLLGFLSERLDLETECLILLTSDHGMTPLPGLARGSGLDAGLVVTGPVGGNVDWPNVATVIDDTLDRSFGQAEWVVSVPYPSVKLNGEAAIAAGIEIVSVAGKARSALLTLPGVESVVTLPELAQGENPGLDVWPALMKWFVPDRCGDLVVSVKPLYTWSSPEYAGKGGTNHGSSYDDDCRIPLVFYGRGTTKSTRDDPASQVDITPSLLNLTGLESTTSYDGESLF